LQDVGFGYTGGRQVLEHVDFEIRPGERIALVGGSASGKSTLVELMYGMREPRTGIVAIDGIDMKTLDLDSVRANIALVQGIEIFDGNVLQNVLLGRDDLTAADARRALEQVGLLDEVLSLPHGLHSFLLNGGRSLSVGHGQLLMLARAIVGRPRLLLLDETLDTLDAEVRWRLLPLLTDRTAPWTLVVVTRRPDVIDLCDRVVALERDQPGQPAHIAERGRGDLNLPRRPGGTP
jgi:ABC-type multidrug transport system fused ATPase/permease subunit